MRDMRVELHHIFFSRRRQDTVVKVHARACHALGLDTREARNWQICIGLVCRWWAAIISTSQKQVSAATLESSKHDP